MGEGTNTDCERTGRWHVALLLFVGCNYAFVSINQILPSFHAFTPSYFCQVEEGGNVTRVDGCLVDQHCETGYQFESLRNDKTIVTEWGLVCERRLLKPLIATLYYCGVMVGAPLGGLTADRYGRRLVMLVCLYCQGALGLALYATNTLVLFTVVRSIQGIFVQGLQGSTYTLLMELFPPKTRTVAGIVLEIYWAVGMSLLAACSYFIADWRNLQLALTVPTLLTLSYAFFIPESPRWLVTRGRHVEAEQVLRNIARLNGFTQNKDSKKEQHKNGNISVLPDSTKSSYEMNSLNTNTQPSSTKTFETDAVIVGCQVKDNTVHSSVNKTSTCFKDAFSDSKTNLTVEEIATSCEPSPAGANGSASVPTKQDAVNVFSVANGVGQDMKVQTVAATERKGGVLDLFRNTLMRKYSGLMIYIWFSVSLCYYGIVFYLPALSGNRHLNFFMGGVLEAVSYCIAYFVLSRLGRRYPQAVYLLLSGVLCIGVGILGSLQTNSSTLQTVLALLGKAAVVSSFCTIFIYTAELFPTVVRAAATGFCAFGSRVGTLLAPQLLLLGEFTTNVVPLVSMGALAMMAGAATLLLPETLGRPLPDTVQQAEDMDTTRKQKEKASTTVDEQC